MFKKPRDFIKSIAKEIEEGEDALYYRWNAVDKVSPSNNHSFRLYLGVFLNKPTLEINRVVINLRGSEKRLLMRAFFTHETESHKAKQKEAINKYFNTIEEVRYT